MLTRAAIGDECSGDRSTWSVREDDMTFLRRRASEEAERAHAATGPDAAKAHLRLAAAYLARIAKADGAESSGEGR